MDLNQDDNSSRKRNPNILQALDPMHRSLLNSNLRYEQGIIQYSLIKCDLCVFVGQHLQLFCKIFIATNELSIPLSR